MDKFIKKEEANLSGEWLCSKQPRRVSKPVPKPTISKPVKREKNSAPSSSASQKSEKSERLPKEWKALVRKVCSPGFKAEYERIALQGYDKAKEISTLKEKGGPVRNAEARAQLMHGYDCECCAPYYDALNLSPGERQRRINQVSRHRGFEPIPRTPPRYWDINFPSIEEQRKLGLLVETNSPLFKKKGSRRNVFKRRTSRST